MIRSAPITFQSDLAEGPVCDLCGRRPSTPEHARQALLNGESDELEVYAVSWEEEWGNALHVGWVCAGQIHGNLRDSAAEGRRLRELRASEVQP